MVTSVEQDPRWSMAFTHVYVHMPAYAHTCTHHTHMGIGKTHTDINTHTHRVGGERERVI